MIVSEPPGAGALSCRSTTWLFGNLPDTFRQARSVVGTSYGKTRKRAGQMIPLATLSQQAYAPLVSLRRK